MFHEEKMQFFKHNTYQCMCGIKPPSPSLCQSHVDQDNIWNFPKKQPRF